MERSRESLRECARSSPAASEEEMLSICLLWLLTKPPLLRRPMPDNIDTDRLPASLPASLSETTVDS
jgi:hypothetical protein